MCKFRRTVETGRYLICLGQDYTVVYGFWGAFCLGERGIGMKKLKEVDVMEELSKAGYMPTREEVASAIRLRGIISPPNEECWPIESILHMMFLRGRTEYQILEFAVGERILH